MSRRIMLRIFTLFIVCILHTSGTWCINIDISSVPVRCAGDNDGKIVVSVSDATGKFTVRLSSAMNNKILDQKSLNKDTVINFTNLSANDYKILVISSEELIEEPFTLTEPEPLKANLIKMVQMPSNENTCNGILAAQPTGGTPPYTFKWGENANNSVHTKIENLCFGTYRCEITDSLKCDVVSATYFLYQNTN